MKLSRTLMIGVTVIGMLTANPLFAKTAGSTASPMTSAEIGTLATIAAIDKNEILIGVIASNKKADSGVVDFAKMMIEQHGNNLTQILEMANSLHATSLTGGEADKLSMLGRKEMMELAALQGKEFDKAYVNAMVKGHQAALDLIDHHLMKTAKSEEMKKFLTDTKATVEKHLAHAEKLQKNMNA